MGSGQIRATSPDLGPQKVAKEGNSGIPLVSRKIQVGELVAHAHIASPSEMPVIDEDDRPEAVELHGCCQLC